MAKKENKLPGLKKQIKENKLCSLYLMYGEEVYIKDAYIKRIADLIDDGSFPDFNRAEIDAADCDTADIDDAVESFPMMSEKKVIILNDSGIFEKASEEKKEYWQKRLSDIPPHAVLIFNEKSVDKRSALYKTAAKIGYDAEFSYMEESEAVTWVGREAQKAKKKITKDTAQYFVSLCDPGLSNIKNELDKLIAFCGGDISKDDVSRIVSKSVNVRVFELTDSIMEKNATGALGILYELKTVRESAFRLLYLLSGTFDKMLHILLLTEAGTPRDIAAKEAGISPYFAQKYLKSAASFGKDYLIDRICAVADTDLAIKNGEIPEWDALFKFVTDSVEYKK